ncbi:exodeoxyribonuclease V subunit gamma, partial [Burkholderia pseudomallei]|nr:exodeoxyribonuclease V subunit gamma [Burkholderia pseudomallei]
RGVWSLAFGVQRSAFSAQRSAFSVQRSAFSVQRSAFSVQRSAFSVQRSAFSVQRSAFSVGRGFSLGFRSRWTPAGISFLARRPPCDSVAATTGADTGARRSHSTNRTAESSTARATNA